MADTFPTALSLVVVERLQEAKKKKKCHLSFDTTNLAIGNKKSGCLQIIFCRGQIGLRI